MKQIRLDTNKEYSFTQKESSDGTTVDVFEKDKNIMSIWYGDLALVTYNEEDVAKVMNYFYHKALEAKKTNQRY